MGLIVTFIIYMGHVVTLLQCTPSTLLQFKPHGEEASFEMDYLDGVIGVESWVMFAGGSSTVT